MRNRSTAVGYVGIGVSILAGLLFVLSDFTTYVRATQFQGWFNLWHLSRSSAVATLILGIAAIALFIVAIFSAREHLVIAGLVCNVFNGGLSLSAPIGTKLREWHLFGVAWYFGIAAAGLAVVGGLLAYYGEAADWEAEKAADFTRGSVLPEYVASPPISPSPAQPPVGWYPDPAQPGRQRLWAGDRWTAETR